MKQQTFIFKLMNHDSDFRHTKPKFEKFTLSELNQINESNYQTIQDAIDSDPEYLFSKSEMKQFTINPESI